jgi:hypothetical protein
MPHQGDVSSDDAKSFTISTWFEFEGLLSECMQNIVNSSRFKNVSLPASTQQICNKPDHDFEESDNQSEPTDAETLMLNLLFCKREPFAKPREAL